MAKKRKRQASSKVATSANHESPAGVTWTPESAQPIKDAPFVEEKSKGKAPVPVISAEAYSADGTDTGDMNKADEDENDPALLRELLEPLPKDQLLSLVHDAALKYPELRASLLQTADVDPAHRKVFVHGYGWNITRETLANVFRQYREIEDCKSVVNKLTGKSKGYGFILFKHWRGARRALKESQKLIGNRMAACQLASIGPVPAPPPAPPVSEYTERKINVSNVGPEILQCFSKFGEIEEGPLRLKKALEEPHKSLDGHILHCQKAIDGPKPNMREVYLPQGCGQYTGLHQGTVGFGIQFPQTRRSDRTVISQVGGTGHLIAPSAGMGFNQSGVPVNNGVHALNSTFGNQAVGFKSYLKPGSVNVYRMTQVQGSYGGGSMGQGSVGAHQGFGRLGGVEPYMGH